jgi:hypothetical protein
MAEEGYVKFLVRLPAGLMATIKRAAEENDRTVTGEIVHRLRQTIRADERKERRDG